PCGGPHATQRCFARLNDAWRVQFPQATELPRWVDLLKKGIDIYALDFDAIFTAMYVMSTSGEGAEYVCVPPDPGIRTSASAAPGTRVSATPGAGEAAALGAYASAPPGTESTAALHTFTLDSGASRCFFRDRTALEPLARLVAVSFADPSGGPVIATSSTVLPCPAVPSGTLSGLHLPSFSTNLVAGCALQDGGVHQFTPAYERVTHCTCARTGRHLATFTRQPGSDLYTLTTGSPQVAASASASASGQLSAPCSCRSLAHEAVLWHHRLGQPSVQRLRAMHSRYLVSGLPRVLPPLPPSPAPPCLPCLEGRQRAAPHSSFPPTTAPLQTLHMDVWGPARVRGQGQERYFLIVVDDYSRYTTVFPLRTKGENGVAERRIGLVMEVARTSLIHAAAPHFLWPFAVWYAAHQLNLWPRVSLPETSPTLLWTGEVGDASRFRVWGSRAFVRDTSADKLSSRAVPCVFLGFVPDAPGWQFYHATSRRVLPSQNVTFDESVPYYRLFPYRTAPLPPPPLFLVLSAAVVDPLPPQGAAPSGVSQVDPVEPVEVAVDSRPAAGVEPGGVEPGGAEPGGAEPGGAESGGAEPGGAESGGTEPGGAESGGTEPWGAETRSLEPGGPESEGPVPESPTPGGALSSAQLREWYFQYCSLRRGTSGARRPTGAGACASPPRRELPSRDQIREWYERRCTLRSGAPGVTDPGTAGAAPGATGPGVGAAAGTAVPGVGATAGAEDPGAGATAGAVEPDVGAAAGTEDSGVGAATGAEDPGAGAAAGTVESGVGAAAGAEDSGVGAVAGPEDPGTGDSAGPGVAARRRPYFVPLLHQVLGPSPSPGPSPPSACPQPVQSQLELRPASPLPAPSPYTGPTGGLAERREPASRPASPVRPARTSGCGSRQRPPPVPGMHRMSLRPSTAPLRAPLPSPPESPLPALADPASDSLRAASPTVARLLSTVVTDPSFGSTAASALVAELVDFAAHCRLDYAASLVAESASVCPPSVGVYGLRQAPREWHDTLRTTLAALGFAPSTADPSLFLHTDTSLPPFYILVYVDDLVFATADTAGLAYVKSELQKRHTCTDLGELRSYLGLQITRDRARRTITLTQSHMVQQVLQLFGFTYSSPQATPLPTRHSLSALPSDESVESSGPYPELVGCLMYLMTCTRPDLAYPLSILARYVAPGRHRPEHMAAAKRVLRYLCSTSGMGLVLGGRSPVVLTGHAGASWADDQANQRSSQGYSFSLGSGSVSWRATRSSSVLGSSCEAEIYAGAMAAQELRWLTYLLTDLGEPPRSPPVLYVDNKAMLALCREQRLEHKTKHIALRYFLARELQQRGQLRLAYVASEAYTANVFTKALAPCDHQCFCTQLALQLPLSTPCPAPAPGKHPRRPAAYCSAAPRCLAEPRRSAEPRRPAAPRRPAEPRCPPSCTAPSATATSAASTTTAATAATAAMASPICDSRDGVSLFDHTSSVSTARAATADSTVRLKWTTHDAVARLAIRSHVPHAERAQFGQYKTAQSLNDAVVARYSSPTTAALSRLMLPYLFPDLAALATVANLTAHLRTSDARYRAALPTEDHFLSLCPTELTVDLLEERLAAAEKSILVVGASRGDRRTPFFEGCSPVPLLPSVASALLSTSLALRRSGLRLPLVGGAATASARGARVVEGTAGAAAEAVEEAEGVAVEVGVVPGVGASVAAVEVVEAAAEVVEAAAAVVEAAAAVVEVATALVLVEVQPRSVEALVVASASSRRIPVRPRRPNSFVSGTLGVGGLGNVAIFDLDFDAILAAMYALTDSAEGDCYLSVPPDPGIEAAALGARASAAPGAGESALFGTAPTEALHTFTVDSGASHSFFREGTTLTPLSRPVAVSLADPSGGAVLAHSSTVLPCPAAPSGLLSGLHLPLSECYCSLACSGVLYSEYDPLGFPISDLPDTWVDQFVPGGQRVTHSTCSRMGRHLATFTHRPGSSLYTLTTASPPVSASGQVAASSQVFAATSRSSPASAPCSCRPLSHETLLWHHRLGHPSLPRLRGMASRTLVSGLPRSLPPLPPGPAPSRVPCVEGRQRAAPHSSTFPPTEAPLQTLHMDLSERFGSDLPVLCLHSDRGGEFSSDLIRAFCRAESIRQTFTLLASPHQNGRIAERRIGMVMDVARTSMIHAAAPHFLWPFAVQYIAHQINLQPRVSFPETTPTLRWTGKVGDASAFRVWGSRAFVRDTSVDKLSSRAVPCVFLSFPPDAAGWHFYHPTSRHVLSSQDVTFDKSGPAPSGVSQVDPAEPIEVAVDSAGEAEIYAGAMAALELHRLTYLLTGLGELPRSPPVLYVDNKAVLAL
ncbi:unnamed protein product, partial [Closterium sp. NIES-54]